MALFTPKLNTVFASRWKALGWAASVMLSAYCSIPSSDEIKNKQPTAQAATVTAQPSASQSPWALNPPAGGTATAPTH